MTNPSLTLKSLTFSDGTTIRFGVNDIIVLVGPNNAGKSVALREIVKNHPSKKENVVIRDIDWQTDGTSQQLLVMVKTHLDELKNQGVETVYSGLRVGIKESDVNTWPANPHVFLPLFSRIVETKDRIIGSDPVNAVNVMQPGSVTLPLQLLYSHRDVEHRLSSYFKRAFNQDLIAVRSGGKWPLYVGDRPKVAVGEESSDATYLDKIVSNTRPLEKQGDGMRSYTSVILGLLATDYISMMLVDEPESFLHPPQARLLGEFMAKERPQNSQLIIATHSQDVLIGLLSSRPHNLRIIRLNRDGSTNYVSELNSSRAEQIATDPLMKYSGVLSGVFHKRVIICESDADCMFYNSLLELPEVNGSLYPDVLFAHGSGKHRLAKLVRALSELNVATDVIVDIDIMRDLADFKALVESLAGDWAQLESDASMVKQAIEARKRLLELDDVKNEVDSIFDAYKESEFNPKSAIRQIKEVFKKASPWDRVKHDGEAAIPGGDVRKRWENLKANCGSIGLWIVPVGELEGWDREFGGHGPLWVQRVLRGRNLASASELKGARAFVRSIWGRI